LPEQKGQQIGICWRVAEQAVLFGGLLGCLVQRRWGTHPQWGARRDAGGTAPPPPAAARGAAAPAGEKRRGARPVKGGH